MASTAPRRRFYEFGSFRIDEENRLLYHREEVVQLQPKTFDILLALVESQGRVIEKEELMRRVWPDSFVEESNLSQNIYVLRKLFGSDAEGQKYIETIPKRGYRFVAEVNESREEASRPILKDHTAPHGPQGENVIAFPGPPDIFNYAADSPPSEPSSPRRLTLSKRNLAIALTGIVVIIAGASFVTYLLIARGKSRDAGSVHRQSAPAGSFEKMRIRKLTDTGNVIGSAVAPDGKYAAYTLCESGRRCSLWLEQIATGSATRLVPAGVVEWGIAFSRDSNYIYFQVAEKGVGAVYQVAALGGARRKIASDVWSHISVSPDDKQIAFMRWGTGENQLIIANIDGAGERKIAVKKPPEYFEMWSGGPAWSPDGTKIACIAGDKRGQMLVEARVEDGSQQQIGAYIWSFIENIEWLPDSGGLIVAGAEKPEMFSQLWQVSYPGGEKRRITNDLNRYRSVSLTSDSRTLVAEQVESFAHLWVLPEGDEKRARQITFGNSKRDGASGISWTPDGRIVYSSESDGRIEIWSVAADGTDQKQITTGAGTLNARPAVSPDGWRIAFISNRAGQENLWIMDSDGRNPKQLAFGAERNPGWSLDGNWVLFTDCSNHPWVVSKIPAGGGKPVQIKVNGEAITVSPDGKLIVYNFFDQQNETPWRSAIIPFEGGEPIRTFRYYYRGLWRWTPDGKGLTYIDASDSFNIWIQPVDGGAPRRLTRFKSGAVHWMEWSRDGKSIALSRGDERRDVVLITDFK
ncbi:MAG: winged helix-turn-helix domain-containing protein [Acidobacteria bacterium]|nr:winged helix-turn-helix domain-containing protein [Acidobacteriota bacterium]